MQLLKKAPAMSHREALFEQDATVVHEQGGGGQSHAQDKAGFLLLVKTNGHRQHQSQRLPKPLTEEHIVAQW